MKFTIILLAEVEIEDEGFLSDYARDELAAGRVENLRPATMREFKAEGWDTYLIPRLTNIAEVCGIACDNGDGTAARMADFVIAKEPNGH